MSTIPHDIPPQDEGGLRPPPGLSDWQRVWWWFNFIILVKLARLRFVAILIVIAVVITQWDLLTAYYEKWTRPAAGTSKAAAGGDYEWMASFLAHRRKVLDFQAEARIDTQDQRGRGAALQWIAFDPAGRPLQAQGLADRSNALADNVLPIEQQSRFAETPPRDRRIEDFRHKVGQRLRPGPLWIGNAGRHSPFMHPAVDRR